MNNFIEYFYNIKVDKISFNNNYYYFNYNGYLYKLYIYENNNDINLMIDIDKKLLVNTLISEIIFNKDNQVISIYNNISYILIKVYVNPDKQVSLEEINYLQNTIFLEKLNINWGILWSNKIDYLEDLIYENGIKYPTIVSSFNYYVGMCENAIAYYNSIPIDKEIHYVISHKKIRIDDTVESLYNPLNIIFDYRARDIAEYIKISFFKDNKNIMNELIIYLNNNPLSLMEVKLLISRLLYPSYYFDLYEDILVNGKDEIIINNIINKSDDFEIYLANIISYFKNYYNVDEINWLKKRLN